MAYSMPDILEICTERLGQAEEWIRQRETRPEYFLLVETRVDRLEREVMQMQLKLGAAVEQIDALANRLDEMQPRVHRLVDQLLQHEKGLDFRFYYSHMAFKNKMNELERLVTGASKTKTIKFRSVLAFRSVAASGVIFGPPPPLEIETQPFGCWEL